LEEINDKMAEIQTKPYTHKLEIKMSSNQIIFDLPKAYFREAANTLMTRKKFFRVAPMVIRFCPLIPNLRAKVGMGFIDYRTNPPNITCVKEFIANGVYFLAIEMQTECTLENKNLIKGICQIESEGVDISADGAQLITWSMLEYSDIAHFRKELNFEPYRIPDEDASSVQDIQDFAKFIGTSMKVQVNSMKTLKTSYSINLLSNNKSHNLLDQPEYSRDDHEVSDTSTTLNVPTTISTVLPIPVEHKRYAE